MSDGTKPSYRVYTVEDREDAEDSYWTQIGAAFAHGDNEGMNIVLRALPVDGRLVLRRYTEKSDQGTDASDSKAD